MDSAKKIDENEPDIKDHEFKEPTGPAYCGLCGLPWKRHAYRSERRNR